MLFWFLAVCIPLPLIVLTLRPDLMEDKSKPDCEDPLATTTTTTTTNTNSSTSKTTTNEVKKSISISDYIFRTRNAVLQAILGSILYGGFGVFFIYGYHWLDENSIHRPISIATVLFSMLAFAFATLSSPKAIYSPIHKDHMPPEIKNLKPGMAIPKDIQEAVKERFEEYWDHNIGKYRYDNTVFFQHAWCSDCQQPRPARSQHCSLCGYCVARADHHCWWLNTHVGEGNYHIFVGMLAVMSWLSTYGSWIMYTVIQNIAKSYQLDESISAYLVDNNLTDWYHVPWLLFHLYKHQFLALRYTLLWTWFALIWCLMIPVVLFLCYHIRLVLVNSTSLEDTKKIYLERWLKNTFIGNALDEKINLSDKTVLALKSIQDREEYWKKNHINEFIDASVEANGSDDGEKVVTGGEEEIVGCVPLSSDDTKTRSNSSKSIAKKHQDDEVNGCFPAQQCSDCNDNCNVAKDGEKYTPRKLARVPFPNIIYPSTLPEYTKTADEEYLSKVIKEQKRPQGYQGWFEPDVSPFITPPPQSTSSSSDDKKENDIKQPSQLPPPEYWTREYFIFAMEQNPYDLGSYWMNFKDAFGYLKKEEYNPFDEYSLETLIQLKADWESKLKKDLDDKEDKKIK